jgi:ABC-type uncharacterized transport system auxiliary subunit
MRGTASCMAGKAWLPAPAPQPRDPSPYTAVLMPFRAPDQLEQDRIIYRPSPVEVDYYDYHRWAEQPADALTAALAGRLRAQHVFSDLTIFDGKVKGDYRIRGRLERLEEVDSGESVSVQVAMSADVVDSKTNKTVWSGSASQSQPVSQGEVQAVVEAMSRAVDACLTQITAGIEGFAKSLPPAPAPASAASR